MWWMSWCLAGLQLALLFIPMSSQACSSCDQLLEEGESGGEGAAPGPLPSPSRMLRVHLSVCLSLLLTLCLGLFLSFHVHLLLGFLFSFSLLPSSLLGQLGATVLWHEPFRVASAFRAGGATESAHFRIPHPKSWLVVRCSVTTREKLEFSHTWVLASTPLLADHEILAKYVNFSEPQCPPV